MDITNKIDRLIGESKRGGAVIEGRMQFDDRHIAYVANSLTDKEWFVLGIFIGYKSNTRKRELEHWTEQYDIPITEQEYDQLVKSLSNKRAIGKRGLEPQSRKIWEFKFGRKLPSQVPHWINDLKF